MLFRYVLALVLVGVPLAARAQLLDELLPQTVPGYELPGSWLAMRRQLAPGATDWHVGAMTLAPELGLQTGYDSSPNGARGSSVFGIAPSLGFQDDAAAFGGYAQINHQSYPQAPQQSLLNAMVAMGKRVQMGNQAFVLAGGFIHTAQTGFSVGGLALARPDPFSYFNLRARDKITMGSLICTPELAAGFYRFPDNHVQDRRDIRGNLTLRYNNGAPLSYVLALRSDNSNSLTQQEDGNSYAALVGVEDESEDLWHISLLAGMAKRLARSAAATTAPVLEARLGWSPDRLDVLNLTIQREIDDPDRLSVMPYTLTEGDFSFTRTGLQNLTATFKGTIQQADYIHDPLRELILTTNMKLAWQMTPFLALSGQYQFNDRQSAQIGAANEHIVLLNVSWTP